MAPLSQLPRRRDPISRFQHSLPSSRIHDAPIGVCTACSDIVGIALCAVIAGAQDWQQIETLDANAETGWINSPGASPMASPSHDTFECVFNRLKLPSVPGLLPGLGPGHQFRFAHSLRGHRRQDTASWLRVGEKLGPLHLVSGTWATDQHLSLGQVAVDAKSNEITAIPALLELLDLNASW